MESESCPLILYWLLVPEYLELADTLAATTETRQVDHFHFSLLIVYLSVRCFEKEVCLKHLNKVCVGPIKSTFSFNLLCI